MEKFENILEAIIGRPELKVNVSNPFPLVGEVVRLDAHSRWVTEHQYTLRDGLQFREETKQAVVGKSTNSITMVDDLDTLQEIKVSNSAGEKTVTKRLYAMMEELDPYMDVSVSKEIIRNDGEKTRIILVGDNGYKFSVSTTLTLWVYKENTRENPVKSYAMADMVIEAIDSFHNRVVSPEFDLTDRGIYDIVVEASDSRTLSGMTIHKQVNKLITVTPKLAAREDAMVVILKDIDAITGPDGVTQLNESNPPTSKTIILKKDPNHKGGNYRSRFTLENLSGTWDDPYIITVDEAEDPVVIEWESWWGFRLSNTHHVVVDGRGYQDIKNGIKMYNPNNDGTTAIWAGVDGADESELFGIEISGSGFSGITCKTDPVSGKPEFWFPTFKFNRLLLHHLYIHDTTGEATYIGYFGTGTLESNGVRYRPHHLYNCRMYRNDFIDIGYDVQANNMEHFEICYNTLSNVGNRRDANQNASFSLSLSGKIYNNRVSKANGLLMQFGALATVEVFNNIMTDSNEGSATILVLNDEDTPEMNPNGDKTNDLPILIYNNVFESNASIAVNARNVVQHRGMRCFDNLFVQDGDTMFGGQSAETNALWAANSAGNILLNKIGKTKDEVFALMDSTYKMGDSANHDVRVASDSPLVGAGSGNKFSFDFNGYSNWYQSLYPVGAYMGRFKKDGIDETFRILTLTLDDGVLQTASGLVAIQWTHYGSLPITDYQVSESAEFALAEWVNYTVDVPVTYQLTGSKGRRTLYVRLRDSSNAVTEGKSVSTTWVRRTAKLAIMASDVASGKFNSDTGIHYHRLDIGKNVIFKDALGNDMGVINSDKASNVYAGSGFTTGDESGIYPDKVLEKTGSVRFNTTAKIIEEPLIITLSNLTAGTYKVSVFANSNKGLNEVSRADLDLITPYFKFAANDVEAGAILLFKNFDTLVEVGNVTVTDGGQITLTAYWHNDVLGVTKAMGYVYGAINLIEIEEV